MNHWRVGYGSDTEGPGQTTVTAETTTTRDRARQNLVLRIRQFQAIAKQKMGAHVWAALNDNQKAAITSLVYNYGHLPIHVDADDPDATASHIKALRAANAGVNRKRRLKEAAMYLKPIGPPAIHPGPVIVGTGGTAGAVAAIHWTCGPCLWAAGLAVGGAIVAAAYLFWKRKAFWKSEPPPQPEPKLQLLDEFRMLMEVRAKVQKRLEEMRPELQAIGNDISSFLAA
ncbi:MAG: hypothetical protein C5B60_10295 [Chloroflexi bacterium]|nr:MAG: hypothetical protein C5B60_10295 [Chloroflexota bacterium]